MAELIAFEAAHRTRMAGTSEASAIPIFHMGNHMREKPTRGDASVVPLVLRGLYES